MPAPSIKSTAEALSVRFFHSAKRNKGEYDLIHPACCGYMLAASLSITLSSSSASFAPAPRMPGQVEFIQSMFIFSIGPRCYSKGKIAQQTLYNTECLVYQQSRQLNILNWPP